MWEEEFNSGLIHFRDVFIARARVLCTDKEASRRPGQFVGPEPCAGLLWGEDWGREGL